MNSNLFFKSGLDIFLKSYLWHLDIIVSGTLCVSVVANINFTKDGGSSSIFKRALKAHLESIWTSSIIYTLNLAFVGLKLALEMISLILSTHVLLAASISITSTKLSVFIAIHISHLLHGFQFCKSRQFTPLANILAVEVFHVPLGPQRR
jgi:hypothetical protein